jgi:nicotinamide riboside kinase
MKIALIGTPRSGKSDLAHRLATELKIPPVDQYVEELADTTNLYLSYGASYIPNLLVVLIRLIKELEAHDIHKGHITCGTAVDTMAYCALFSSHVKEDSSPVEIQEDAIRSAIIMNAINLSLDENWRYDKVFYLPTKSDRKLDRELDYAIREVLATLSIDHTPLTDEDQFTQAMSVIGDTRDVETPATPE